MVVLGIPESFEMLQEGGEISSQLAEANSALQAAQLQVTNLTQQLREAERKGDESSAAAESSAQQLATASTQLVDSQQQVLPCSVLP